MIWSYRGHLVIEHGGSLAGQRSTILRAPNDGYGIAVTVNDDDFGTQFSEFATKTILDDLLGLEPIDWEERIFGDMLGKKEDKVFPPTTPRKAPTNADIRGSYIAKGYGNITLHPLSDYEHTSTIHSTALISSVSELTQNGPSLPLDQIYVSEYPKFISSHLVITPFDGPLMNWTTAWVREVIDEDGSTGEYIGAFVRSGPAVWTESGIGLFGSFWGAGTDVEDVEAVEVDVREKAEVWFERV
jgi:hypothetical protein